MKIETKEIQKSTAKHFVLRGHQFVCENFGFYGIEMDVATISKSKMLYEFEVKISKSDFNADKKKSVRTMCDGSMSKSKLDKYIDFENRKDSVPNYFSYVVPENLISEIDIPKFAGLYFFDGKEIYSVKEPKRIHAEIIDTDWLTKKMLRIYSERTYLGACRMTYENKLNIERNKKYL